MYQKKKKGDASFSNEQRGRKPSTSVASYQSLTDTEKVAILEKRLNERNEAIMSIVIVKENLNKSEVK